MNSERASGILLHPTSLPGRFGIGDLGREAYRFADFLTGARQRLWQVLPLGPTNRSGSPYQNLSVFAGNPLLISPEMLVEDKLLDRSALKAAPVFEEKKVDFKGISKFKMSLLKESFIFFMKKATPYQRGRFRAFCKQKSSWLDDYALFMALQDAHDSAGWNEWEVDIRTRQPQAMREWSKKLEWDIQCQKYQQFLFFNQWSRLRNYCNNRGIKLIGDMPIFVALECDTVWSNPHMFCLDSQGKPTVVSGVPPDYFSKTGQLWENPLYRWNVMKKDGYSWWIERLRAMFSMVDIVRIDHFRGFEKYWEIPAGDKTARNGRWMPGPGAKLFKAVRKSLGNVPLIAEDLGLITPEVDALREKLGLPGMRVLQFAFGGTSPINPYLPHNYPRNCVVYTGTHDNNTTVGWFRDEGRSILSRKAREKERQFALKYLGTDGSEINWDFIRLALSSVADTAIVPLQDIMGLGGEARMNCPAKRNGNWVWRFTRDMLTKDMKDRLGELTLTYGRAHP